MTVKQYKTGKYAGLWKATIDFPNTYARIGTYEYFDTRYEAEDWLRSVKRQFGKRK